MRISVIVPLYNGKRYIDSILKMLIKNLNYDSSGRLELEVIFINDQPEEVINELYYVRKYASVKRLTLHIVENKVNRGIHYSRVRGLQMANGKWIHFLDQDDVISNNYYLSQLQHLQKGDVIVGNGYSELEQGRRVLYKYSFMHETVKYLFFYLFFSCRILSPGQCLIRKKAIPHKWKKDIITQNGADDLYLWILMLLNHCKFKINRECIYLHKYTKVNFSLNIHKMKKSDEEVSKYVEDDLPHIYKWIMKKRFDSKYKKGKFVSFIEGLNKI